MFYTVWGQVSHQQNCHKHHQQSADLSWNHSEYSFHSCLIKTAKLKTILLPWSLQIFYMFYYNSVWREGGLDLSAWPSENRGTEVMETLESGCGVPHKGDAGIAPDGAPIWMACWLSTRSSWACFTYLVVHLVAFLGGNNWSIVGWGAQASKLVARA